MAVSWRPDQLDPPRPIFAPVERANRNQTVQSSRRRKHTRDRAGASRGMIGGTMANTTKCAAPEGNRGRDEWMTVLEIQEYMGGKPEQGVRPHLVGRDRLVQARKKAPGVEGVSERLHRFEERQELTAATAPRAARGRAREGASRRKELEDDHDHESESTPIPLTPSTPPSGGFRRPADWAFRTLRGPDLPVSYVSWPGCI